MTRQLHRCLPDGGTHVHLCIKRRFGHEYVQELDDLATTPIDVMLASVRKGPPNRTVKFVHR